MNALQTNRGSLATLGRSIWKARGKYFLLIPGMVWYLIFAYVPMYGLSLAFRTYKANLGIFGSPWVGWANYSYVFRDPDFIDAVFRTLRINAGRLLFQFPFPILLALMIHELRVGRFKKGLQVIYTFPHFLSWVIVASVTVNVLSVNGIVNQFVRYMGFSSIDFLGSISKFLPIVYISEIWKSAGWSAIIYLAAIAGIDTEQYEAAEIDGASRLQRMFQITLPNIRETILVLFILSVGGLMTAGFDQLFNISNPATIKAAETLDMYIYRVTFKSAADFSFSSAVSLFKSVINFLLLVAADRLSKKVNGSGLFG